MSVFRTFYVMLLKKDCVLLSKNVFSALNLMNLIGRKDGMVVKRLTWISVKTNEIPDVSQRIPLTKVLILMIVQAGRGPFFSDG